MDKPNKGNTIKIKLNGEDKQFQEETPKKDPNSSPASPTKVIKINSDLIESDVMMETAAAQESVDESFDWILPESLNNEIEEFKIVSTTTAKKNGPKKGSTLSSNNIKKNNRPLGTFLITAIFAILIGLTFGFVMLKLVITTPGEKRVTETVVTEEKGTTNNETEKSNGKKTATAELGQLTSYVIQGGVFSSKEGAKDTAAEIAAKGVPSNLVEMDGKQYLFLGVADSIEMAKSLSSKYKENGVAEVFAKPLIVDEKKVSNITEEEKTFLETVPTIYQALSLVTSSAMVEKAIPNVSSKVIVSVEEQLKSSSYPNKNVKSLHGELNGAVDKIKSFQKTKDTKSLSAAQQHLLNFLSIYYSL